MVGGMSMLSDQCSQHVGDILTIFMLIIRTNKNYEKAFEDLGMGCETNVKTDYQNVD